jgi:hypothetical protein
MRLSIRLPQWLRDWRSRSKQLLIREPRRGERNEKNAVSRDCLTAAQQSFAEQLLHAAGSNYYFPDTVMGKKHPNDYRVTIQRIN